MRIGIDCRLAGWQHAGIGRYVENLLRYLPKITADRTDITWVYFFHDSAQAEAISQNWPNTVELRFAPVRHYTIWEQIRMPVVFTAAKLDLLHVPHFNIPWFYSGKIVVTIHDLLWHEQKGSHVTTLKPWIYWLKYGFYQLTVQLAVTRASQIYVPAKTIAQTIAKYYPEAMSKTVVTKEGIAELYRQQAPSHNEQTTFKPNQRHCRLVYTGSLYPHKNLKIVFQALSKHPDWHLTIVGARSVFQDQTKQLVTQLGIEKQVVFAGFLTDQALIELYQQSHALVQPSLSEGFGLTGIEAMATGTLVVASNIPIFQEIYQDAALYFDPHSTADCEEAILRTLSLSETAQLAQKNKGLKIIEQYSWEKMSAQTSECYQTIT